MRAGCALAHSPSSIRKLLPNFQSAPASVIASFRDSSSSPALTHCVKTCWLGRPRIWATRKTAVAGPDATARKIPRKRSLRSSYQSSVRISLNLASYSNLKPAHLSKMTARYSPSNAAPSRRRFIRVGASNGFWPDFSLTIHSSRFSRIFLYAAAIFLPSSVFFSQ